MSPDMVVGLMLGACGAFVVSLVALLWALAEIIVEVRVKEPPP